jgi:hypothetical protein
MTIGARSQVEIVVTVSLMHVLVSFFGAGG